MLPLGSATSEKSTAKKSTLKTVKALIEGLSEEQVKKLNELQYRYVQEFSRAVKPQLKTYIVGNPTAKKKVAVYSAATAQNKHRQQLFHMDNAQQCYKAMIKLIVSAKAQQEAAKKALEEEQKKAAEQQKIAVEQEKQAISIANELNETLKSLRHAIKNNNKTDIETAIHNLTCLAQNQTIPDVIQERVQSCIKKLGELSAMDMNSKQRAIYDGIIIGYQAEISVYIRLALAGKIKTA
jgi:hypothetical protein